jgi:hypothetical protein
MTDYFHEIVELEMVSLGTFCHHLPLVDIIFDIRHGENCENDENGKFFIILATVAMMVKMAK